MSITRYSHRDPAKRAAVAIHMETAPTEAHLDVREVLIEFHGGEQEAIRAGEWDDRPEFALLMAAYRAGQLWGDFALAMGAYRAGQLCGDD